MAAYFEKRLGPMAGEPAAPAGENNETRLDIAVVYTSVEATVAALRHASTLASNLSGRITLLVPQVVPFQEPLSSPPVLIDWNERRFRAIASVSAVDITVRVFLCRDHDEALLAALPGRSLVILGAAHLRWRFSAERRLARKLGRAGHEVVLIAAE